MDGKRRRVEHVLEVADFVGPVLGEEGPELGVTVGDGESNLGLFGATIADQVFADRLG
jgi:hypothetical protein